VAGFDAMNNKGNTSQCRELLRQMVEIDSVNASISHRRFPEQELAQYLESYARALGFEVARLMMEDGSYNLLITARTRETDPWIVFDSHMDTVGFEGTTVSPPAGEIRENRMCGRGSCDTKASGAAMLVALARTMESSKLGNNVALLFTTDEEAGKSGAIAFRDSVKAEFGWEPRVVVVGEPTRMRPVVAHNGMLRIGIEAKGISVHSSRPELGRSAISDILKVVAAIEAEYAPSLKTIHPLTGAPRCSVNMIHGGRQFNVVPESCRIDVDRRVIPGEDLCTIHRDFEFLLDTLRSRIAGLDVQIVDSKSEEPMNPLQIDTLMQWLIPVLSRFQIPTEPLGAPYGTNAAKYTEVGWPAVVLGPGDIAQAHTADEWIDLSMLDLAVDVYSHLMQAPFTLKK
jgi:acetylornithine deacetylase